MNFYIVFSFCLYLCIVCFPVPSCSSHACFLSFVSFSIVFWIFKSLFSFCQYDIHVFCFHHDPYSSSYALFLLFPCSPFSSIFISVFWFCLNCIYAFYRVPCISSHVLFFIFSLIIPLFCEFSKWFSHLSYVTFIYFIIFLLTFSTQPASVFQIWQYQTVCFSPSALEPLTRHHNKQGEGLAPPLAFICQQPYQNLALLLRPCTECSASPF